MEDSRFNPFPGLRPFDFGEQHLFFGREGQSEQVLRHLRENRFLAVVGTSGSGKSSLIRAGLLPDLYGGFMAGAGSHWRFAIFRPMNDPIGNMARALNKPDVLQIEPPTGGDQTRSDMLLEVTLRRSGLGLVEATRLARIPANQNLLVVVDQFEELFRFAAAANSASQADDAAAFVKLLLEASLQSEVPIYIVITMRSDFIGDCAKFPDLPEAVTAGMYLIPRMTREQRRRAIEEPVAVGGGAVSLRLVNRLLNEVGDNPDQLPILQHALMRTWEHWVKRTSGTESFADDPIDFADYEAIGGISGALSNHADEAYDALPDARRREIAKRMFQCLTEKGSDNREVRRPTTVGRIAAVAHASTEEVVDVIEEFHKQGRSFLTTPAGVALTGDAVIDISHESLIRLWVRLKEWVNQESESAGTYCRLADDAERHARGQTSVLRDPELQNALNWKRDEHPSAEWAERYHPNFAEVMSFLDRSCEARAAAEAEKERQRTEELARVRRHLRIVRGLSAVAVAFAVAAGVSSYLAQRNAHEADARAAEAKSEKARADVARDDATDKKLEADSMRVAADKERDNAKGAQAEAEKQKGIANKERDNAKDAQAEAEAQRLIADNERDKARKAQTAAEEEKHFADELLVKDKESDEKINQFLDDDMRSVNKLVDEPSLPSAVQEMVEASIKRRIDFTSKVLDKDHDNRTALTINTISRDTLARVYVKRKPHEEALKAVEENQHVGESRVHDSKNYYAKAVGAALIGVSADMLRMLKEKDKALEAAKSAAEAADSVGFKADPEGKDNVYLNMLSIAYNNVGFVDNSYKQQEQAAVAYRKAADARGKSFHISPSDSAIGYFVEDCEGLASVEKDLGRFGNALKEYEEAVAELNQYLSGKTPTPAFSGILVRLHSERGDVFVKNKNYSAAEDEYQKASEKANEIKRDEAAGQIEGIEADRTVGIAWRGLASEQTETAVAEKYNKMAFRHSQRGLEHDLDLLKKDFAQGENNVIAKRYKDLTYAYFNVALDHFDLHEYEDARKSYNKRVEAAAEVSKRDPSDDSLRYLAECYHTIVTFELKSGVFNVPNAFEADRRRIEILKPIAIRKGADHEDVTNLAAALGTQGWLELLLGDFTASLADSEAALNYDSTILVGGDQGHALLFLHRTEEARSAYVKYAGESTPDSDNLILRLSTGAVPPKWTSRPSSPWKLRF